MQSHTIRRSLQPLWLLFHANANAATYTCFPKSMNISNKKLPAKKMQNLNSATFPLQDYFEPKKWSALILGVFSFHPICGKTHPERNTYAGKRQGHRGSLFIQMDQTERC